MLGHTDITTAYNHYIKPRESMYKQTQKRVSSVVPLGKVFKSDKRSENAHFRFRWFRVRP